MSARLTALTPDAAATGAWRIDSPTMLSPILTAALEAFRENGYHGTSVRDIARRVGVTVPALYYHHANKEAILVGLLEPVITDLEARCALALSEAGDDLDLRFFNIVECLMLHVTHNARLAHLDNEIRSLSPIEHEAYTTKRRRIEEMLRVTVENGAEAGHFEVDSAKESARALLGMIQAVSVWFRPQGRRTAAEVAADYVVISSRTVGARPEVLQRLR